MESRIDAFVFTKNESAKNCVFETLEKEQF